MRHNGLNARRYTICSMFDTIPRVQRTLGGTREIELALPCSVLHQYSLHWAKQGSSYRGRTVRVKAFMLSSCDCSLKQIDVVSKIVSADSKKLHRGISPPRRSMSLPVQERSRRKRIGSIFCLWLATGTLTFCVLPT